MAAQLDGVASFQPLLFLRASKNLSIIFSWTSFILLIVVTALIANDFVHYELTEMTNYTTEKVSVVVYFYPTKQGYLLVDLLVPQFLHLVGFYAALIALVWTNETTHKRHRIPHIITLLMSHVVVFLARTACEVLYINYRPEFYRDVDEGDYVSPYCASTIDEQ